MNHVTLFGNLGADPEVRYTPKGDACCEFNLAVTERWKDDQGQPQESTYWGRCQVWGVSGETFAQYFRKGSKVLIEGRLKNDNWTDKKSGEARSSTRIKVEKWHFVTPAPDSRAQPAKTNQPRPQAPPAAQAPCNDKPLAPPAQNEPPTPEPEEDDVPF